MITGFERSIEDGKLVIRVGPQRRRLIVTMVLFFCVWLLDVAFAVSMARGGSPRGASAIAGLATIAVPMLAFVVARDLGLTEIMRVTPKELLIERAGFGRRLWHARFAANEVRNLRAAGVDPGMLVFWNVPGTVAFEHLDRTYSFGVRLNRSEARKLVSEVMEYIG